MSNFTPLYQSLGLILVFIIGSGTAVGQKIFKYSENGTPTTFDPVQSATHYSNDVVTGVYDTLYSYRYLKRPFELKPNLAAAMPAISKDGKTYTIKIKEGVLFQDDACFPNGKGREVVAGDFIYSIKRHFDPKETSQGKWLWQGKIVGADDWSKTADYSKEIPGLKALDKYTIQITLTQTYPQFIYTLAMGYSAVVPKEAVSKYGREFPIKPVGSGPWKLRSHDTRRTVLVKNPTYRKDVFNASEEGYDEKLHGFTGIKSLDGKTMPFVDVMELHWMKETVARWNSFTKGNEIQWTVLANEQMNEVLESKQPVKLRKKFAEKYHIRPETEAGFIFTHFNMDFPDIGYSADPKQNEKNRALRCAIRKSTNWETKIDRFYLGLGQAFPGVIPTILDGYDPKLSRESVTQDVEGAKKLLKDHGWTAANLPVLEYGSVASVLSKQLFELFRGNLAEIGYPIAKVKLKTYATFGDFAKDLKARKVMLIPMGWGLDYPDAENTLGLFYGPNASPGSNAANYVNPAFDSLYAKASTMQPGPERTEIYKQLNKIVIDDCVSISGFSRSNVYLWHKNAIIWPQREMVGSIHKYLDVK